MPDQLTNDNILAILGGVKDPEIGRDPSSLGMVKTITINGSAVDLTVELTTPACPLKGQDRGGHRQALTTFGATTVRVEWASNVKRTFGGPPADLIPGVRNTIAVGAARAAWARPRSVNLAVALAQLGAKVGLMDADMYGPNVPLMMGTADAKPFSRDGKLIEPIEAHGVRLMSIGFLVSPRTPPRVARSACSTARSGSSWAT